MRDKNNEYSDETLNETVIGLEYKRTHLPVREGVDKFVIFSLGIAVLAGLAIVFPITPEYIDTGSLLLNVVIWSGISVVQWYIAYKGAQRSLFFDQQQLALDPPHIPKLSAIQGKEESEE